MKETNKKTCKNIKESLKLTTSGFTLVELLAVIVILAIILVIAVPKVMSVIEDAKKATLESTAKMIASGAEKQKVQNTVLGKEKEITCDSVAKINKGDYASCSIEFVDNTAKVTIEGSGKFEDLWVCGGTKTDATAQKDSCNAQSQNIEVNHPLFLAGQELTPDKFVVNAKNSDGSTRTLHKGGLKTDDSKLTTITSPNWPEGCPSLMTEEKDYWEVMYEGVDAIQITFDETSFLMNSEIISIYDKEGNQKYKFSLSSFAGQTYTIYGDYIKVTMKTGRGGISRFSATIKPASNAPAEYAVSPSVVPNTEGNFDITITLNEQEITKKISTKTVHYVEDYVSGLEPFDYNVQQKTITHNETDYNAGIRYVGTLDEVKNKVYYNCDDTDTNGVTYGETGYDYASSCEVWRIIGVFDTKTSLSGEVVPRVKLINTESTFEASWDSSASDINNGNGVNQWGPSTYKDANGVSQTYAGADLMRLLNGYYIGKEGATCTYCNYLGQEKCEQVCDTEDNTLKSQNMKVLTSSAKGMIENAVWDTYGVKDSTDDTLVYLQEKGISAQYTGKNLCVEANGSNYSSCNDGVERTINWTGLVGLMSVSDVAYSNGWLDKNKDKISVKASSSEAYWVYSNIALARPVGEPSEISPSVYLKPGIKVISGNGDDKPFILAK